MTGRRPDRAPAGAATPHGEVRRRRVTRARPLRAGAALWLLPWLWVLLVGAASPARADEPAGAATGTELAQRLDRLSRRGEHEPARSAAQIGALLPAASQPAEQRAIALARAEVLARSGDAASLASARQAAVQAAGRLSPVLAQADGLMLDALRGDRDGQGRADHLATEALAQLDRHCQALPAGAPAPCEARSRWRLHQLLAQRAFHRRDEAQAAEQGRAAMELARALDDPWRQAMTGIVRAHTASVLGDRAEAQLHLGLAETQARRSGEPDLMAQVLITQAELAVEAGMQALAAAPLARALALAEQAQAHRLVAVVHADLADLALRQQPRQATTALREAQAGLAIAQTLGDERLVRVLQHNALLAQVALGQTSAALRALETLQQAWAAEGQTGRQATALREVADALADAGDPAAALALHHRERALSRQLSQANQAAALAALRSRNDRDAQQRNIRLLASENAVKTAELTEQNLARRLWLLGAGAVALALVLTVLLVRRVRETNRQLEHSRARLRLQSERDALTGLANRRHLQAVLQAAQSDQGLRGALLMLDIDHFKQINDAHGHGAGDAVLVAVAQRIAERVREADVVARWGGEEFLILAPALAVAETEALAQRLLAAISGTPVVLPGGTALTVTASLGHAVFPLLPHAVPLRAEQAINLVDMALYRAKRQGRHRAVGIRSAAAADAAGMAALEADFERGWSEGRVALHESAGAAAAPHGAPLAADAAH